MRMIVIFLLASMPLAAKPTILSLGWNEFRAMTEDGMFREKVVIRTGADGMGRTRGRLENIAATGIVLRKSGRQAMIARDAVHSVRLIPRSGNPWKWRTIATIALVPLWFVGLEVGLMIPGGIPEGRVWSNKHLPQGLVGAFALPAGIYWLARRADLGNGAIIVRLEKGKEKQP